MKGAAGEMQQIGRKIKRPFAGRFACSRSAEINAGRVEKPMV